MSSPIYEGLEERKLNSRTKLNFFFIYKVDSAKL